MGDHLSRHYDQEFGVLNAHVAQMSELVERQLRDALDAFEQGNVSLVPAIVARDATVDALEAAIDADCFALIARRQPTAIDLRRIMSASKAVIDLERIGDEAKKIARLSQAIAERGVGSFLAHSIEIRHLGSTVLELVGQARRAFVHADQETAAAIVRRDRDINEHFRAITRQLVTYMMEDPRTISSALDVLFVAKALERIGDHCKNIASDAIYVARGRDVRHLDAEALEREITSP